MNVNAQCLATAGARFPGFEPDYRALVKHVVETRKAVWLTHMRDFSGATETCFDPMTQTVRSCPDVTKDQLLAFATWAKTSLSREAARRVVIAHLGFFSGDPDALTALLDAGSRSTPRPPSKTSRPPAAGPARCWRSTPTSSPGALTPTSARRV